jgi:hypothetical protein
MGKIEQLADLCRITLQRLENMDTAGLLLQADHVFMVHGCSSVNDLLGSLSLSGDRGLVRIMKEAGAGGAARQTVSRRSVNKPPTYHPLQQTALPPPGRSPAGQLSQRQTAAILSLGSDSLSRGRQLVKKLVDDVRQELETKYQEDGRSSQRKRFTTAHDHSSAYYLFPDNRLEHERTDWFDNHPRHKAAASRALPKRTKQFISPRKLKSWAAPPLVDDERKEKNIGTQERTRTPADVASAMGRPAGEGGTDLEDRATESQKVGNLFTGQPRGRTPDTFWDPQGAPASSLQPDASSSQLEQLLRRWKWQGSRETTRRQKDYITKDRTTEEKKDPFPQFAHLSGERGEWNNSAAEQKRFSENDHVFTETLERVLQREIRRHGMEDDP